MKAASLNDIRKELISLDQPALEKLCITLARFKKENKELLSYLLFEAHDEATYTKNVKLELDELFEELPKGNVYFIKKSLRKILRFLNKQIKYSGVEESELDLRIYFCLKIKQASVPLHTGTVLSNLYQQQVKKIHRVLSRLPEDLRYDYDREIKLI